MKRIASLIAVGMAMLTLAPASAFADSEQAACLFRLGLNPIGQSYGEWAVEWLAVGAFSQPVAANPVLDTTGAQWRKGTARPGLVPRGELRLSPRHPARVLCRPGKALLIPVLNLGYFAFPNDPPATRTEAYVPRAGKLHGERHQSHSDNRRRLRTEHQQPLLRGISAVQGHPPANNVFGLPDGFHLDPSVDAGGTTWS